MYNTIIDYLKDVRNELLRVCWPSKKEVVAASILVLVILFLSSAAFLLVDHFAQIAINFFVSVGHGS